MIPSTLFCDNCGAANQAQAAYCRLCGNTLPIVKPAIYHFATGRLLANVLLRRRYRIMASLGTGGMGAVYQAEDTQLGNRQVAIKEMIQSSPNQQEQKKAAEAFRQEAIMLARLQHPNLPSIFDHFEENGRWYLVMSFLEGETFASYLGHVQGGKLAGEDVLQVGIQLCTVLSYLHGQQPAIIFRDLKPANIMRTVEGHLYLIDFGIARHFKPGQTRDTTYYGSMGYAPPEQYGRAQTTPRSDIYSLGAILHQILSGHDPVATPFRFPELPSLVPTIPPRLSLLVSQMLDLAEEKRPASALVVKRELQALLSVSRPTPLAPSAGPITPLPEVATVLPPTPPAPTKEQWLQAGLHHSKAKHYTEALAAYEQAMRLDPNFADAYKQKALTLSEARPTAEALNACEQALRLLPYDAALYYCKATVLQSLGRNEEAIRVYEQVIHLHPTDERGYYGKADLLETLGRREEALLALEQVIRLNPEEVRGYYREADLLEALDRREEALAILEQAIHFAPTDTHGYKAKAILLETLDRNEEALSIREQVIHLDSQDAYNHYFKGYLLEKLNRNEEALDTYEQAIRLAPHDDFMYERKGSVLKKLGRYGEALDAYEQAILIKPDFANAYRGKGDVLEHLGRPAEARQAYERARACELA